MSSDLLQIVRVLTGHAVDPEKRDPNDLIDRFLELCRHPGGTDLLFYPANCALGLAPSPEEIVDAAINWRPRILAMTIVRIREHRQRHDLTCYVVEANHIHVQVVSAMKFAVGDVCAVALSGVRLPNGREIKHGFVERAYSAGEILGPTDARPGTELSGEYAGQAALSDNCQREREPRQE